jgi:predicted phage tail protein
VRIYSTALSAAQIQTDMNTPMGLGALPTPAVALTSPATGAAYATGTAVPVAATATVAGDTITKVDFMANGALIGSDATSPYGITWTPAAAGTYTITALAQGSLGGSATSAGANVTISAPTSNAPPSVSITFPAAGATFSAGASINVAATASDSNGSIASVTFYHSGSQLIGTDTTNPYGATWSNVAAGTYSLTAVALDNGGASTVSAAVMITVSAASSLPRSLVFTASTDHATLVTSYTMDVFASGANPSTAVPVRTQNLGKPAPVNGDITVDIASLVQGLPAGSYFLTVTAVGSAGSTRSTASPTFQR